MHEYLCRLIQTATEKPEDKKQVEEEDVEKKVEIFNAANAISFCGALMAGERTDVLQHAEVNPGASRAMNVLSRAALKTIQAAVVRDGRCM